VSNSPTSNETTRDVSEHQQAPNTNVKNNNKNNMESMTAAAGAGHGVPGPDALRARLTSERERQETAMRSANSTEQLLVRQHFFHFSLSLTSLSLTFI
jgi:hypothetical protein